MGERLTADRLAEIEATLARRYPDVEDGDAICADCFASVRVHDGAEWSNGDSLCDGCAGSRLARTERALTDLLAEVRGLTAERDNLPRLWWVRDDAEEGACCYDAPTAAEAVAKALPDFGYEPDDDADLTVLPVTELHVSGLQDEVRTLRARVAELDEAAGDAAAPTPAGICGWCLGSSCAPTPTSSAGARSVPGRRWPVADPNPCLVPLASLGLDPDVLARVQAIADQRIPKGNNRSAGAVLCLLHGYHRLAHPETAHACQDLQQADFSTVPRTDWVLASPACQGHTPARGKERPHHDALRSTAWAVVTAAEVCRPEVCVVENVGSRLLFSQRAALDRAGAPTTGRDGAPVSDGWRAAWVAEELIRVRAERDELRGRLPVTIEMDTDSLRSEINRLILEHLPTAVAPLEAERDALRARVAELKEAARWRAAKDAPNLEPVAIRLRDDVGDTKGTLVEGRRNNRHGEHKWSTPLGMCSDDDVLGWRPLGPGPEVSGG